MRGLSILYVGTLPPHPGGSAVSGSQILIGLARLGHAVRALAPIAGEAPDTADPFATEHPEVRVTRFPVPYYETAPNTPSPDAYRRREAAAIRSGLDRLVRAQRPDIVFIGRESFAAHVLPAARAHAIPCIVRLAGSTTLGIVSGTYAGPRAGQLLEQLRRTDLLVTPAHHLADRVRSLGLERVRTIPNAIDLRAFAPGPGDERLRRALSIPPGDVVLLHASNLKAIKRPQDIVRSAALTLPHDPRLTYLIVGEGECRQSMEDACRHAGLAHRFRFTGWIEYARMAEYINLGDVVIMPSEFEAQARVYLEAQACGRLLLASDVPGAREVIVDGVTGLLFKAGDVDDLAAQTLRAATNPTLRADIGRAARVSVEAHAIDDAVAAYETALRDVVRRRAI